MTTVKRRFELRWEDTVGNRSQEGNCKGTSDLYGGIPPFAGVLIGKQVVTGRGNQLAADGKIRGAGLKGSITSHRKSHPFRVVIGSLGESHRLPEEKGRLGWTGADVGFEHEKPLEDAVRNKET